MIEEGERSFDLVVMGGTSPEGRLLIELPFLFSTASLVFWPTIAVLILQETLER